jgi:predicted dithiol-disulfide oxidoreductase (DUF899 family)
MKTPAIVTRAEWLAARRELLAREKEWTRQRDALSAARRRLPMVKLETEYVFAGPQGPVTLRDLFGRHRQLIVYHFMFDPSWDEGCKSCSHCADNFAGALVHHAARDTAFAAVSRAPLGKIDAFKRRMGWTFPWVSSLGTAFNYDFHVTLDPAEGSVEYNYADADALHRAGKLWSTKGELPGLSVFLRDGDDAVAEIHAATYISAALAWHGDLPVLEYDDVAAFISIFLPSASGLRVVRAELKGRRGRLAMRCARHLVPATRASPPPIRR